MRTKAHRAGNWGRRGGTLALAVGLAYGAAGEGFASHPSHGDGWGTEAMGRQVAHAGPVELDHVVAVVNGELIFASQVDEERRFAVFQPLSEMMEKPTDEELLERLIDRTLILQQARMQPEEPISDEKVDAEIAVLRKTIPECEPDRCATEAEWTRFVEAHGFTTEEVRDRWRERMEMLRFIEERFRMGIRISQAEIDDYYKKTLVPAFVERGATVPAEDTVSARVQEILLQQQVNKLLEDWLQTLRAQGTVRVVKPGEAMP